MLLLFCCTPRCNHVLRLLPPESTCLFTLLHAGPAQALAIAGLPLRLGALGLRSAAGVAGVIAACSRAGVLLRRACALERAAARVCREAGAWVRKERVWQGPLSQLWSLGIQLCSPSQPSFPLPLDCSQTPLVRHSPAAVCLGDALGRPKPWWIS